MYSASYLGLSTWAMLPRLLRTAVLPVLAPNTSGRAATAAPYHDRAKPCTAASDRGNPGTLRIGIAGRTALAGRRGRRMWRSCPRGSRCPRRGRSVLSPLVRAGQGDGWPGGPSGAGKSSCSSPRGCCRRSTAVTGRRARAIAWRPASLDFPRHAGRQHPPRRSRRHRCRGTGRRRGRPGLALRQPASARAGHAGG